jgi:hypothetical protein
MHTYIPLTLYPRRGIAETSQTFLRDTHILPTKAMRNTVDVTGGKPSSPSDLSASQVCVLLIL